MFFSLLYAKSKPVYSVGRARFRSQVVLRTPNNAILSMHLQQCYSIHASTERILMLFFFKKFNGFLPLFFLYWLNLTRSQSVEHQRLFYATFLLLHVL